MKKERLYLKTSGYNTAMMLEELKRIVVDKGGKVLKNEYVEKYIITNRTVENAIRNIKDRIDELESIVSSSDNENKNALRRKAIEAKKEELKRFQAIKNDPIEVDFKSYMYFIFDNYYYYVSFDDNPFFPAHYHRIKLNDDGLSYTGNYYIEELNFINDDLFKAGSNMKENATLLFDTLLNSSISKKYRNSKKMRVCNLYNGGYHYETIYEKEKTYYINKTRFINE